MAIEIKGGSRRRRRRSRPIAGGLIITLVMLLLLGVIGSMLYVWYTGQQNPIEPEPLPTTKKTQPIVEKPKAKPEGPVGIASQVFTSPVAQGDNASITIRTRPEAACSITVTYKDRQRSSDGGLLPKTADEFGTAQWTWTVEDSRPVGKWPVEVTCALGEESGYLKLDLEVVPKAA